jgi:GNAT superfamily N-acetyltransferase
MVLKKAQPVESITIRNARPDEFEVLGQLMVRVYSKLDGFPGAAIIPEYYRMLANIGEMTHRPGAELLVAVSPDEKITGGLVYFKEMKSYGAGGSATLETNAAAFRLLAVDAEYQGKGIGKLLVKECINKTKALGLAQLILHTTESMKTAWKMYEGLGFTRAADLDFEQSNLKVFGFRLFLSS